MTVLHDEIFHKTDYIALDDIQRVALIKKIIFQWGISALIEEIAEVLQTDTEEDVFIVSLILRDICIKNRQIPDFNEIVEKCRYAVEKSAIFQHMNINLYSHDRLIRETSYITFGKIAFTHNKVYLKKAINYYKEHFPDQLERLEFEYTWLAHLN